MKKNEKETDKETDKENNNNSFKDIIQLSNYWNKFQASLLLKSLKPNYLPFAAMAMQAQNLRAFGPHSKPDRVWHILSNLDATKIDFYLSNIAQLMKKTNIVSPIKD